MSIKDVQGMRGCASALRPVNGPKRAILAGLAMVMTEDVRKLTIVPVAVLLMAAEVVD